MPKPYIRKHPRAEELYTPITPEIRALFVRLHDELVTWRAVAETVQTKSRVIRRVRSDRNAAISMTLLDRVIQKGGIGSLIDYTWFTADDMVALGIWKPIMPDGATVDGDDGVTERGKREGRKLHRKSTKK